MISRAQQLLNRRPLQVALLGLLAFAVYAFALSNGFAYDDVVIVKGDTRVTQFQLAPIFSKPYWASPGLALYRPLVTFSFALDWKISGGHPAWFHAVNGLWHALATGTLFLFLLAWFRTAPAALAAALFAVHPVHVEAVANVVGRAELMAATFFLLACVCWAHGWPRSRARRLVLVGVLYCLAILCKESAVTLPAILFLIDAGNGRWRVSDLPARLRTRLPEYGLLAAILATFVVVRGILAGGVTPTQLDPLMEVTESSADRLRTALQIWPYIVRLLFLPTQLLADYGPGMVMPAIGWNSLSLLGACILSALVLGGLLLFWRGQQLGALSMLWLPITLLPVANLLFPIGVLLAERTLYVPSIALSLACALLLSSAQQAAPITRRVLAVAVLAFLVFSVVRVQIRIPDWDSTDSIMMALRRDRPDSFRAEWHAARMARRDKQPDLALRRYRRALELWPYRERLVVETAGFMSEQRDAAGALRVARFGAQRWPRSVGVQRLLAANALDAGDTATARAALAAGLRLAPRDSLMLKMNAVLNPEKAAR